MSRSDDSYPLSLPVAPTSYPVLQLIALHGGLLAAVTGLVLAVAGFLAWSTGFGWGWAMAGLLLGAFAYLMMRCLAELVHLIADTLIPK
jgi:hypothetical protein